MFGYNGRILRVNLSEEKITTEEPGEDYYRRYLGGRGFIAETLLREIPGGGRSPRAGKQAHLRPWPHYGGAPGRGRSGGCL